jgi:serine/threonine-protein kinase
MAMRRALSIARQMLAGLAHAHACDIVHRDIKPENILVTQTVGFDDHVRILDFGLAKLMDSAAQLTAGMALGTPHYMAPEQMREGGVDGRMDIYGVGLVLYEMLTGQKAFDAPTTAEVLLKQQRRPPPAFREIAPTIALPAALEAVVRRALEKSPDDRFPTALAMREALDACADAPVVNSERTVFEPSPWGAQGPPAARPRRAVAVRVRLARYGQRAQRVVQAVGGALRKRWPRNRRTQLALAGAAVAVVAALWIILRSPAPSPAPGRAAVVAPAKGARVAKPGAPPGVAGAPADGKLAEVDAMVAEGRVDEALARLRTLRAESPTNADYAAAMARLSFQRHRYGEAVSAYRAAIRNDKERRNDAAMIRLVIDSMESDRFATQAQDFLREIGSSAKPLVKEAGRSHRNARVRDRARDLLRYWDHKPWFRR